MENKKINQNSKLITEFIGRQGKIRKDLYTFIGVSDINNNDPWFTLEDAKFHSSWDWLMSVIRKIKQVIYDDDYRVKKSYGQSVKCVELYLSIFNSFQHIDILITYKIVLKFINWYNKNK